MFHKQNYTAAEDRTYINISEIVIKCILHLIMLM